jgi:hypothetical protein
MLRSIFIALAVAASLFAFAWLGEAPGGALVRAGGGVALGVMVATFAYGQITWMTVAAGALSPLAFVALEERSLGLATASMCILWLAPRFVLAETRGRLAILAVASVTAAVTGGFVFAGNIDGPLSARIASCVFAGSCLSLVGILVPVDTSVAWALRTASAVIGSPARDVLERAARAHRQASRLSTSSAKRVQWRALVQLGDHRAALERIEGRDADESRRDLDERIATQASELAPLETPAGTEVATPEAEAPAEPEVTLADEAGDPDPALPAIARETAEP